MGSGSSKKATPTVVRGFTREQTMKPVSIAKPDTQASAGNTVENQPEKPAVNQNGGQQLVEKAMSTNSQGDKATAPAIDDPEIKEIIDKLAIFVARNGQEFETLTKQRQQGNPKFGFLYGGKNYAYYQYRVQTEQANATFVKTVFGKCNSQWPIRCFGKLDFNVNAQHGGCASLYLNSCQFGGKGEETNAQLMLLRSGFDCNHLQRVPIAASHQGHFGASNGHYVAEDGQLVADCLFGNNRLMLLTNDSKYTNLRNGVYGQISDTDRYELPIDLNCSALMLLLCSSLDGDAFVSSLYMIRTGFKDNKFQTKCLTGDDKFTFEAGDGQLFVKGATGSQFGLFYNQDALKGKQEHAYVCHTQSLNGKEPECLMKAQTGHSTLLVLCSNSNGTEDSTVASVYVLSINGGRVVASNQLKGCHGDSYSSSDLWTFEIVSGDVKATGPPGPCRYAVMSNIQSSKEELARSIKQDFCLATGEQSKVTGSVKVTDDKVTGSVSMVSDICIMYDHMHVKTIPSGEVTKDGSSFQFSYSWAGDQKEVGYHIIRVFAVRKHLKSDEEVFIELTGSPSNLTRQKPGVAFAVNCGGPAYQASSDVTYDSEFKNFASFTYDNCFGSRYTTLGEAKILTNQPALMLKTNDGFMYSTFRSVGTEAIKEQSVTYRVKDVPNGNYMLRVHLIDTILNMTVNGEEVSHSIREGLSKKKRPTDLSGPTGYVVDCPVRVTDNQLLLQTYAGDNNKHAEKLFGLALLNHKYQEKTTPASKLQEYKEEKQKLSDTTLPLTSTATKKELTIVGWSPNLVLNSTGEMGNLTHWDVRGTVVVRDGGYGTEKAFVTSHTWGSKSQTIDLLQHFTAEYLDTAPDIQVQEWYREGVCGGGYYQFTATLLSESGQVIKDYTTGEIGRIYQENKWSEAGKVFTDYGPGVRQVVIESRGKDDKFWAGNYGPLMSAATVRVKRESKPAEDDAFTDIVMPEGDQSKPLIDQIVSTVLSNNQELLKSFMMEEEERISDEDYEKQSKIKASMHRRETNKPKMRKKREVRVFVSSTFRDFTEEREEIIKKAFKEINRMCSERGVFFTYVDLRWGITSEQTDDGKTISICLEEIGRCRPYFLCMMGERFGWSQKQGEKDETLNMSYDYAIENNPALSWIDDYRFDSSVTQLEVFHGVLNNIEKAKDRAFFYMRDPPIESELTEKMYKRRIAESEWHSERQTALKNKVKEHKELNVRQFKLASEVAELIKEDLTQSIDEDFPKGTELTKLEQQREAHGAFAAARCRVYIGREQYFTDINHNLNRGIDQPFVLLGESGSGKSALVANWAKRVDDSNPDAFKFVHFIGSSADSASYTKILRRLYEEMKLFYNFDMEVPSSDAQLINELGKWLRMAGSICKVIIVLDALNQLDEGVGEDGPEHDLMWLPPKLPPNVFLLLSTLPGRAMTACENSEWPHMRVEPLDDSQKLQIITDYLTGIYGKTLSNDQKELLVESKQTSNALYLKSLLDEIRVYGSFRTLTDKMKDYLSAENPGDLFYKILERLEADFEQGSNARRVDVVFESVLTSLTSIVVNCDAFVAQEKLTNQQPSLTKYLKRENIVHDTVTAIWCSHKGMSEGELVQLLEVPSAVWSPFFLSLYENLVNRNGVLNFSHDHLRQAVEKKYLSTPDKKRAGYLRLVEFFSKQETSNRTVEELPFLLMRSEETERLKSYLKDLDVFYRLSESDDGQFELIKAWKTVGDFALTEKAYLGELEQIPSKDIQQNPDHYCKLYSNLGKFFHSIGLLGAAKTVYITLIKQLEVNYGETHGTIVYHHVEQSYKYRCKHPEVIKSLQELANVYRGLGDLNMAVKVFTDAINRQNRIETPTQSLQLCHGLMGLAGVHVQKENMPEAKKLMTRALELATDVLGKRHHYVATIFTQLGQLSYKQGRLDEALGYYLQDLKVTRSEVGTSHPRMATVLNEIGLVFDDKNDELAGRLYETALMIILETFGPNYLGTGTIRYNLGAFYFGTNHFAKCKYQMEESYKIHVNFLGEDHPDTKDVKSALDTVSKMV